MNINEYLKNRIDECKKNRDKALDVGNLALAREWATAIKELVDVKKEVDVEND